MRTEIAFPLFFDLITFTLSLANCRAGATRSAIAAEPIVLECELPKLVDGI